MVPAGAETFGGLGEIHAHGFERGHWWLVAHAVARDASIAFEPDVNALRLAEDDMGGLPMELFSFWGEIADSSSPSYAF